jgi:hypothetical protein
MDLKTEKALSFDEGYGKVLADIQMAIEKLEEEHFGIKEEVKR